MNKEYPKVLVINGEPFSDKTATGITMKNLFQGWPLNKLAVVYTSPIPPDTAICNKYWKLSSRDSILVHHFRHNNTSTGSTAEHNSGTTAWEPFLAREIRNWFQCVPYHLSNELELWIKDFAPDIVYSLGGDIKLMWLTADISNKHKLPVVFHFMDDWISSLFKKPWQFVQRCLLKQSLSKVLTNTSICFTISQAMADEYRIKFSKECIPFMNCVEIPDFLPESYEPADGTVKFVYIGGLHLKRWQNLLQIADCIKSLQDAGLKAVLKIHAPAADMENFADTFKNHAAVICAGSLRQEEIQENLAKADVLVHVESFDPQLSCYTRLSISTKIPQYFASAKPILGYGPENLTSMKVIKDAMAGIVAGDQDALKDAVNKLAESCILRRTLGGQGYNYAAINHCKAKVQDDFAKLLLKAANLGFRIPLECKPPIL